MMNKKGDAAVTIIIVVVVLLIIIVSYFMFFRNDNEELGNMNNPGNMNDTNANTGENNQVGIYDGNNTNLENNVDGTNGNLDNNNNRSNMDFNNTNSNDMSNEITIENENANNFYQRVKRGITLNGNLVEVPAEYLTRLTNKIGQVGYELTDDVSNVVNSKYDEIEQTLADNNVSDINDLDAATKDRIQSLIQDIDNAL